MLYGGDGDWLMSCKAAMEMMSSPAAMAMTVCLVMVPNLATAYDASLDGKRQPGWRRGE
ncbi:MAG: hypothetical protein KatS3mg082_2824 [Nitrospiraceae bacterium]|nr:MAG: hypothetical protein KatS3mg082_2824 [Nitrospiraceae bacterium]